MIHETTFPCLACGAPVEPEANRDYMACTYCGTNLEIPGSLRKKTAPPRETPRNHLPDSGVVVDVPELLRRAQPVARGALNLLFLYQWLKRLIPACFTIAIVLFFLCILAGALLSVWHGIR